MTIIAWALVAAYLATAVACGFAYGLSERKSPFVAAFFGIAWLPATVFMLWQAAIRETLLWWRGR
jgi:hypothetical protein